MLNKHYISFCTLIVASLFLKYKVSSYAFRTSHDRHTQTVLYSSNAEIASATVKKSFKERFISSSINTILNSPLRGIIVGQAKKTMKKSAEEVGIPWQELYDDVFQSLNWDERVKGIISEDPKLITPDYYKSKFHAYDEGNLCMQAAIEQELAGKSVGVRNFPSYRDKAEEKLRSCYEDQLKRLGGMIPLAQNVNSGLAIALDLGCGTGTSTRRLASLFPDADEVIGIDLSPHMIAVGRALHQRQTPIGSIPWVTDIPDDVSKISLRYGDAAKTGLPDNSVAFVNLCFLYHELPVAAAKDIIKEAYRVLQPGGIVGMMEMDPTAPGYRKLRKNPALFSIFKSTEPYLDEYFDQVAPNLPTILSEVGFSSIRIAAATGRHFTLVAAKDGPLDFRPSDEIRLAMDEHLNSPLKMASSVEAKQE